MAPVWLDWLATFSTAAAAILALLAINESRRQGIENARMIVADRQAQYGLGVLREIVEVLSRDVPFANLHNELRGLVLVCPVELHLLRIPLGLTHQQHGLVKYQETIAMTVDTGEPVSERIRPYMQQEVREAIKHYLEHLSVDPGYQPGITQTPWRRLVRFASRNSGSHL